MGWIAVGVVLLLTGATVVVLADRRSAEAGIARGMVVGLGAGLAGWGVVALVVGLVRTV